MQGVKNAYIYPWPSLVGPTGVIKSQILYVLVISHLLLLYVMFISLSLCMQIVHFTIGYDVFP